MTGSRVNTPSTSPIQILSSPSPPVPMQGLQSTSTWPLNPLSNPTPPPRPLSAQGVSVIAPKPMRVPLYRPQFTRFPNSMFEFGSGDKDKEISPNAPLLNDRRSSSTSNTGAMEEDTENTNDIRGPLYSPTIDAVDELFKIVHKRSSSNANTSATPLFVKPIALHPRSPNMRHKRNTSDASDTSMQGLIRRTPDIDWRHSPVSPVARHLNRNPMVRDPSFNSESK